jgi:hypothetical protein
MGRPRKDPKDRLTRTITARVSDDQFDWLIDRMDEGEFSASLREAIDLARTFEGLLCNPDPVAALRKILKETEAAAAREAYFDEFGHYPGEK